ncbi:hypothetical protein ACQKE5_03395 [Paenisporosarcina sp. NPDC076898]|uniref:hypothetical protein n=1 Tax=Paenisporosarcina sp. NPDC076898 TaxID=3390603 RepID=UPI003D04FEEF
MSGCSVVKFGVHVVKNGSDVGKRRGHVGKIAIHVGIPFIPHQHFTKKAAERSEQPPFKALQNL